MPQPTLIVVDVQQALDDPSWGERNNPGAERKIAAALAAWRDAGAPIVHVRDRSRDPGGLFQPGTPAFEYKPEARPAAGEPELTKSANCAFVGTDLEQRLRRAGATTVAIVGLTTDHCCSSTARMAADLGFETWIVEDAMATYQRADLDGTPIPADTIHRAALASLNGEVGEVMPLSEAVERLRGAPASNAGR
ncbi:MAG TPA: cysteine hydrolase family protein [Thermoleophilaceae bacterium]